MENSTILAFLNSNWVDIVIVIAALFLIWFIRRIIVKYDRTGKVRGIITTLCIEAEKYLGSDTGALKKEQVIIWFNRRYPTLSLFISDKVLSNLIDSIVDGLNKYLTDNNTTLDGIDTNININKIDAVDIME